MGFSPEENWYFRVSAEIQRVTHADAHIQLDKEETRHEKVSPTWRFIYDSTDRCCARIIKADDKWNLFRRIGRCAWSVDFVTQCERRMYIVTYIDDGAIDVQVTSTTFPSLRYNLLFLKVPVLILVCEEIFALLSKANKIGSISLFLQLQIYRDIQQIYRVTRISSLTTCYNVANSVERHSIKFRLPCN